MKKSKNTEFSEYLFYREIAIDYALRKVASPFTVADFTFFIKEWCEITDTEICTPHRVIWRNHAQVVVGGHNFCSFDRVRKAIERLCVEGECSFYGKRGSAYLYAKEAALHLSEINLRRHDYLLDR